MSVTTPVNIKIKTLTGKEINFSLDKHKTILDLKTNLHEIEGIPIDQQRLIYNGKQLLNERTLSDYNVDEERENLFYLVLCLKKPVILFYNFGNDNPLKVNLKLKNDVWKFHHINPKQPQIRDCDSDYSYKWEFILKSEIGGKNLLFDFNRNRNFSYIFWEAETNVHSNNLFSEFFSYNKKFFFSKNEIEDKLDLLLRRKGLNEVESQDLITYWLPNFYEKDYVAVTFFDEDTYNEFANLEVFPQPENIIRIFLLFKTLTKNEYEEKKKDELLFDELEKEEGHRNREDLNTSLVVEWGVMKIN